MHPTKQNRQISLIVLWKADNVHAGVSGAHSNNRCTTCRRNAVRGGGVMPAMASSERRQQLPPSLMQRLDLLQHLALEATGQTEGRTPGALVVYRPRPPRLGAQAIVLAWFSLGVLASGAMGAGAFYGLRATAAGGTLMTWAAWAKPLSAISAPRPAGRWNDAQWEFAEVTVDRSEPARAQLPLQVTGTDAGSVEIALQGLPAGVRPSHGQPRGPSTWVLQEPDLADLHLVLNETAPKLFNVKVAVLGPAGVATVGSIVHVRVVDGTGQTQAVASDGTNAATADGARSAPVQALAATRAHVAAGNDRTAAAPVRRRGAAPAAGGVTEVAPVGTARSWPEGASGLGAVSRESERQVWWEMPQPSWSPFQDGQAWP
jgi:hypothetical protein